MQNPNYFVVIMALVAVFSSGCGTSAPPQATAMPGIVNDVALWDIPGKATPVPGIDYAAVTHFLWNGQLVFALWVDTDNNDSSRGSSDGHLTGEIKFRDRRPVVKFDCQTLDGKTGSLTVNNQTFDLADGSLILVSTLGGDVRFKQLKREGLATILPNGQREGFEKLNTDLEVVKFFAK